MQEVPSTETILAEQMEYFGSGASRRASTADDLFSGLLNSQFEASRTAQAPSVEPTAVHDETREPHAPTVVSGSDTPTRHAVQDTPAHNSERREAETYREAKSAPKPGVEEGKRLAKGNSTLEEEEHELPDTRNLRMTTEDLSDLVQGLKEFGFSDKEIRALQNRIESDAGLTWGQFVQWVNGRMNATGKSFDLNAAETQQLEGFFGKLGFNSSETADLMSRLRSGNRVEVYNAVAEKLASLDQDTVLNISAKESQAFAKALGLTGKSAQNLQNSLTGSRLPQELQNALAAMKQDIPELREFKLASRVNEVMQQAAVRADEQGDLQRLRQAHDERGITQKAVDSQTEAVKNIRKSETQQQAQPDPRGQESAEDGQQHSDTAENKAWEQFFSRLRTDNTASQLRTDLFQNTRAESATEAAKSAKTAPRWANTSSSRMMEQVEQGIYRSLGNGGARLTVKLAPENLGALSIALTSRGGEVSAMIRADNADTAKMLTDHIETLRTHLENQGIKVDKIDVQAGLSEFGNANNWMGEQQHNRAMQEDAMSMIRQRWNRMRGQTGELARDLQNDVEQAILSGEGIHIIA